MTRPLHQCSTCASFVERECMNLVAFVVPGPAAQFRPPRPDDVCDDYEAEPDRLTDRLMQRLKTRQTENRRKNP